MSPSDSPRLGQFGDWAVSFEMPDASEGADGGTVTLLSCPVCHAMVPSGLTGEHEKWHGSVDFKATFGWGSKV